MHILITGGAGYIGTELVKSLASKNEVASVTIYDNLSRANFNVFLGDNFKGNSKVKFINGELLDSRSLKKALVGIDTVYHLAAKVATPFDSTDAHFYEQVNHWGTAELVYAVEESSNVRQFIYASSTSVYGSTSNWVNETTIPNPRTVYGISKLRAEDHVNRLKDKIKTAIVRCGNVYGYSKSMRFDAVINKFMFEAHFTKRLTVHGNGNQHRSFIHVNDLANALTEIAIQPISPGVYNLVNRTLQILDIVEALKELQPEIEFIFINQHLKLRELRVERNDELNEQLGVSTPIPLIDELDQFRQEFAF